jgi:hypothetical protein
MPKIDENIIQRIIERADIVDVIADHLGTRSPDNPGGLRKTGVRYTALCPFHEDKHDGNFIVYPKGNCFRCFTCDKKGGAVDFLMQYANLSFPDAIRWLGKKYSIETDNIPVNYNPPPPPPPPPPLPMLQLPMGMVLNREYTEGDTLCQWLHSLPWDTCQRERLKNALKEYHVGHARQGHTIFWQIDEQGIVRTGKMMLYKKDGHRDKESRHNFDWIHAALFRDSRHPEYSDEKQECKPTLFGMHLLNKYPYAAIHMVESEKTAIIMATAYGNTRNQLWMACGGVENLSKEKLQPILSQKRKIILYPDRDAIEKWRAKQANLRYDRMSVNVQAVTDWWKEGDGEKADIADVIVRMMTESNKPLTTGDLVLRMPIVKKMIEKFDLELIKEEKGNDR